MLEINHLYTRHALALAEKKIKKKKREASSASRGTYVVESIKLTKE